MTILCNQITVNRLLNWITVSCKVFNLFNSKSNSNADKCNVVWKTLQTLNHDNYAVWLISRKVYFKHCFTAQIIVLWKFHIWNKLKILVIAMSVSMPSVSWADEPENEYREKRHKRFNILFLLQF